MLVLGRTVNERIMIGDNIVITICRIENNHVRVGIDAPKSIPVLREEVIERGKA